MPTYKDHLSSLPIFSTVSKAAQSLGVDAYVVGGYVRDIILKRPSKDVDFVCIGSGIALAKAVSQSLGKDASLSTFKNFGTAAIHHDGFEYEFGGCSKRVVPK